MKISLSSLFALSVLFLSLTQEAQAQNQNLVFKLESLKYIYTVKISRTGDAVKGTFSSNEYDNGRKESVAFDGKISGKVLKVKLDGELQFCAVAGADKDGFYRWKLSDEEETLLIPIHSADEDGNPDVVDMPLDLER